MKPKTVDEYIASFNREQRAKLEEIRNIIKEVLPNVVEGLRWNKPAFVESDGMILAIFSGHNKHMNLVVTPSAKQAFDGDLKDYETGKGSIRFYYDQPLPKALIKKIINYRANEYHNSGVKWM